MVRHSEPRYRLGPEPGLLSSPLARVSGHKRPVAVCSEPKRCNVRHSWDKPRRVVAKADWHPGELFPRVGFVVTKMSAGSVANVRQSMRAGEHPIGGSPLGNKNCQTRRGRSAYSHPMPSLSRSRCLPYPGSPRLIGAAPAARAAVQFGNAPVRPDNGNGAL